MAKLNEMRLKQLKDEKEKKQALEDVIWALINSTEFGYNH